MEKLGTDLMPSPLFVKKTQKHCTQLDVQPNTTVEVSFWTKDFPELIGVGKFTSDENRNIIFVLDYSESTL